ncbi:hypothetical protein SAMN05216264_105148 [Pseudomonas marincola]|nr:hypothetical protein SAMN05216264_105148 [Pseudomonas marincola]
MGAESANKPAIKLSFKLSSPSLRSLFPSEGLSLLIELHPITFERS